jgi:cardiolipin synthase
MFLEMWNAMRETDTDYGKYLVKSGYQAREKGFVNPYADSPLDGEYVGENVYLNMIKHAKHYFYVSTPYLIISDEMSRELCMAAQRGVDVRVITPGVPDKKMVYRLTRSYYNVLVSKGVRIYEYTPGFLHAKQVLCDGELATVGTINFDYRSFYHHFENGVLLYDYDCIENIREDFVKTMAVSQEVTELYRTGKKAVLRIGQCFLRLFAPLL